MAALEDVGRTPADDFSSVYDLCAMQRLMRSLGTYGFLGHVKERAHFLEHIPVAMKSLQEVMASIPGLELLQELLATLSPSLNFAVDPISGR